MAHKNRMAQQQQEKGWGGGGHLLFTDDVSLALSESWFARPYENGMFVCVRERECV